MSKNRFSLKSKMAAKMAACETNDKKKLGYKIQFTFNEALSLISFDDES